MQVGVVGRGDCSREEYEAARETGQLLAKAGATLFCGGLSGVMEAACRGAKEAGGCTVGILPDTGQGNPYLDVVIRTGMGHARNVILVHSSDAIIAVGGSYGTLSEIAIALKTGVAVYGYMSWEIPGVITCETPVKAVTAAISAAGRFPSRRSRPGSPGRI
jgi:uncharacterized protein (TIGR00725 family)